MQENTQVPRQKRRIGCLVVLLLVILAPIIAWKVFEYRFRLRLIPQDLGVWWISYVEQEIWGFGPGGNETGLILYDLPDRAAQAIIADGAPYLETLDSTPRPRRDRGNFFGEWHPTPITTGPLGAPAKIGDYLDRYGFGVELDPSVEAYVNSVISAQGSFYTYARIGIVVIDPKGGKVIHAHSG